MIFLGVSQGQWAGIAVAGFGLTAFCIGIRYIRLRQKQLGYTPILARVVAKHTVYRSLGESHGHVPVIELEYELNGRVFRSTGENELKVLVLHRTAEDAEAQILGVQIGDRMEVYCDPLHPGKAIRYRGAYGAAVSWLCFGVGFTAAGLFLWRNA